MKIFVISLTASSRRDACREQLNGLGLDFEFIDAVDGRTLPSGIKQAHYDAAANAIKFKRPLTDGEIGCYLSHKAAWGIAAQQQRPIIVLEDDFCLSEHFISFVSTVQNEMLDDCLLKLDGKNIDVLPDTNRQSATGKVEIKGYKIIPPYTTGYIIGPAAAARMLAARKTFFRPVDIDIKHSWEHRVSVFGASPIQVTQRLSKAESSLEVDRKSAKSSSAITRIWRNARYQANFKLNLWKYSREQKAAGASIFTGKVISDVNAGTHVAVGG